MHLALKAGGLPAENLESLKHMVLNRYVAKNKLKEVADLFEICIRLKTIRPDENASRQENFGGKHAPTYCIGLVDQHYFPIERVEVTRYCLEY